MSSDTVLLAESQEAAFHAVTYRWCKDTQEAIYEGAGQSVWDVIRQGRAKFPGTVAIPILQFGIRTHNNHIALLQGRMHGITSHFNNISTVRLTQVFFIQADALS